MTSSRCCAAVGLSDPAAPQAPSYKHGWGSIGVRVFAIVLGVGLGTGIAEVALRLSVPIQTRAYVWPPGAKLIRARGPDPTEMPGASGPSLVSIPAPGVRGEVLLPAGQYRILAFGGSTTECLYLDDAETWPSLVQQALPTTTDRRPVWIGNAGRSGASTRDNLLHLRYLSDQLPKLDTALALVGVNDLTGALSNGDHHSPPPPLSDPKTLHRQMRHAFSIVPNIPAEPSFDEENESIFERLLVYELVMKSGAAVVGLMQERGLIRFDFFTKMRENRRHAAAIEDRLPDLEQALREYRSNLIALADLAAERGIRLILMTQPVLWRADLSAAATDLLWLGERNDFQATRGQVYYSAGALDKAMRRYNEMTLDVCRERELACLDLAGQVPRDTLMFFDDCHFTEAGARVVAEAVVKYLQRLPPFVDL